jgi:YfiR/HmsC-like
MEPRLSKRRPSPLLAWRRLCSIMRLVCVAVLALQAVRPDFACADEVAVPIALQASLLARVATYDGNLTSRAGDRIRVFIVTRSGDPDSERLAVQAQNALAGVQTIAGLGHEQTIVAFSSASDLAKLCREKRVTILYLMPGLSEHIEAIAEALVNVSVLTATAIGPDARRGIVVGFDLVSGKTTLLINLRQARYQDVSLGPDVLRLATVYQ